MDSTDSPDFDPLQEVERAEEVRVYLQEEWESSDAFNVFYRTEAFELDEDERIQEELREDFYNPDPENVETPYFRTEVGPEDLWSMLCRSPEDDIFFIEFTGNHYSQGDYINRENDKQPLDLTGINFSRSVWEPVPMRYGSASINVKGAIAHSTYWYFAKLSRVHFVGTDFREAYFGRTDLTNTDFQQARFTSTKFADCSFYQANLQQVQAEGATFRNCGFEGANFTGTKDAPTIFAYCRFKNCTFSKAILHHVCFLKCDFLDRCSMYGAKMRDVDFTGSINWNGASEFYTTAYPPSYPGWPGVRSL